MSAKIKVTKFFETGCLDCEREIRALVSRAWADSDITHLILAQVSMCEHSREEKLRLAAARRKPEVIAPPKSEPPPPPPAPSLFGAGQKPAATLAGTGYDEPGASPETP